MSAEGLFAGRKPRLTEAQVDVIVVAYQPNISSVPWCVDGFHECADVPWNLVVVLDGAAPEDEAPISEHAKTLGCASYRTVRIAQPVQFGAALYAGVMARPGAPLIAVVQPHLRVADPQWFGKVQQTFLQDSAAAVAIFGDVAPNVSNVPFRPPFAADVDTSRQLMMLDPRVLGSIDLTQVRDPGWQKQIVDQVYPTGCFAWVVPTVRIMTLPGRTIHAPKLQHDRTTVKKDRDATRAGAGRDS